jgi:hypothetical protein
MFAATKINNKDLINYYIICGADNWEKSAQIAASKGYISLMEFFLDRYNNYIKQPNDYSLHHFIRKRHPTPILNRLLKSASKGNQIKVIDYLIEKGANDWNYVLYGAARGGH